MSATISLRRAHNLLQKSTRSGRPPVLVVGSGLLHHCHFGPFADWTRLMREVARELGIKADLELAEQHPTLFWESLMAQAARKHRKTAATHEERARKHVQSLVRDASARLRGHALADLAARAGLKSIVTLNFTAEPFTNGRRGRFPRGPVPHLEIDGRIIWCPHGNERNARTICLGARTYARLIDRFETLREEYKAGRHAAGRTRRGKKKAEQPNFVQHILESPLIFAGCGLQSAEWTLWWLLATKARNEARQPACPSIYIAGRQVACLHARALQAMNCTVLQVDGHDAVWKAVERLTKA